MIWNEFRKLWNAVTFLLLLIVGGVLFYSGVMGQMNLNHLPMFEAVEVNIGKELMQSYGTTFDEKEKREIEERYEAAYDQLNETLLNGNPQIIEWGFECFYDLDEYWSYMGEPTTEEEIKIDELYRKVLKQYEKEIEVCNTYKKILYRYQVVDEAGKETELEEVSALPEAVTMNLRFVISDYARMLLFMTILFVLPYAAMDRHAKVYAIVAATKTGRGILKKQISALVAGVLLLQAILDLLFYLIYQYGTSYPVFGTCPVPDLWFNWNLTQLLLARIGMINLCALAVALIFFYLALRVNTVVGTVVMALPCWGLGDVWSIQFLPYTFGRGEKSNMTLYTLWIIDKKYFPILILLLQLILGTVLLGAFYRKRKTQDILE